MFCLAKWACLPLLPDKELPDEVLRQFRRLREELLVKLVVTCHDVGVRLLLGVAEER